MSIEASNIVATTIKLLLGYSIECLSAQVRKRNEDWGPIQPIGTLHSTTQAEDLHLQDKYQRINLGCIRGSPVIGHSPRSIPAGFLRRELKVQSS
jgi:hypothetical protein